MAPEYYIFTGERVPDHVTHVLIDKALKFVRAFAFQEHPNIQEVICHDVEKIERFAFFMCPCLRRVIMPGVKKVEKEAFSNCKALTYIEWGKLEIIEGLAFAGCGLSSIDLPSVKEVAGSCAFSGCTNLINVKFGKDLESIGRLAFYNCPSLQRITLPLKDGMIAHVNTFQMCVNLIQVGLVGGVHETVAALLLDEWKNDMNEEIDSINRILPSTPAGTDRHMDNGRKALAIRSWIRSVLRKIIHYKAEHRRYLNMAAALEPALPNDIIHKSVLPFLAYTLGEED